MMPAMEIASKNFQFAEVNARDSIMRATFIYNNFIYRRQIQFDSIDFNMMDPKIIVMIGPKKIVMFSTCMSAHRNDVMSPSSFRLENRKIRRR
jgi:hypothetical protein